MINLKEYLIEVLQSITLFEMAYSKEKYVDTVCDMSEQIVQNIFLILLSQETARGVEYQKHWLNELDAYVNKLWARSIASDKKRALLQAFDREDLDNPEKLRKMCRRKLQKGAGFSMRIEDVSYEMWNRIKKIIYCDLVRIICDKNCDTYDELYLLLNPD